MVNVRDDGERITLSTVDAQVLLALLLGPMNGYELVRQIESDSGVGTEHRVNYGAVYYSLKGLAACQFVEPIEHTPEDKLPRQFYRISPSGKMVLGWHMAQLRLMVKLAEERSRPERLA